LPIVRDGLLSFGCAVGKTSRLTRPAEPDLGTVDCWYAVV
jgi:hypothetical protein